ncbi:MAG: phage tail assembly protein [Betaproteobacteria bacterium]|nr:phage tail assembly protein [Betaproteobacteria bacterium]
MDAVTVKLKTPIPRGETLLESVEIFKPAGTGWLRGVSMIEVIKMDQKALSTVLPRVTRPALTESDIRIKMDAADLLELGGTIVNFLSPRSEDASESRTE